jgi:hypothetical protein
MNDLVKSQNELLREQVIQQELSARSWKAFYEKMHYTIECNKIEEEYQRVQELNLAKLKQQEENVGQE